MRGLLQVPLGALGEASLHQAQTSNPTPSLEDPLSQPFLQQGYERLPQLRAGVGDRPTSRRLLGSRLRTDLCLSQVVVPVLLPRLKSESQSVPR